MPTTAEAIAASIACARSLGLPGDDPEVIAEGYSVRVRLRPAPIVTRVVTLGRVLRGDPMPWLEREVAVTQFLAGSGAPVVAPSRDAGPFVAEGLEVSLWEWVEQVPGEVTPGMFGALLGQLHTTLSSYDADLPPLVGPLTDINAALRISSDAVLHRAARDLIPVALSWPRRVLHGDAHTGNVLMTADGPRWIDFEDVCVGPPERDLASTTVTDAAVAAYPHPVDFVRLEDCRDLRRLQILAGLLTDDLQDSSLHESIITVLSRRF